MRSLVAMLACSCLVVAVMYWQTDGFHEPATLVDFAKIMPTFLIGSLVSGLLIARMEGI